MTSEKRRLQVARSWNLDGETRCVDVFRRADGSFGFEEYRRDPEDGRGWFAIGSNGEASFASEADATDAARRRVPWLASVIDGRGHG
jgi:hypothetical protein